MKTGRFILIKIHILFIILQDHGSQKVGKLRNFLTKLYRATEFYSGFITILIKY